MALDFVPGLNPPPPDGGPCLWLVFSEGKLLVGEQSPPSLAGDPAAAGLGLAPEGIELGLSDCQTSG